LATRSRSGAAFLVDKLLRPVISAAARAGANAVDMADQDRELGCRLELRAVRSALIGPCDLQVEAGGVVAVSGPSGAGKTLLLRLIADLDASEGTILLDGIDKDRLAPTEWRRRVSYVAAEAGWWEAKAIDHFSHSGAEAARCIAAELGVTASELTAPVARLSTGEKQRLALVRALINKPRVLLLDEPTGALDPTSTQLVEARLRALAAEGTSILLITHELEQVCRLQATHYRMADRRLERLP
jgi:putative ABC transport system ATP-binding protein